MLKVLPEDRMIIGNIDPAGVIRNGDPEMVRRETLGIDGTLLQISEFCHCKRLRYSAHVTS